MTDPAPSSHPDAASQKKARWPALAGLGGLVAAAGVSGALLYGTGAGGNAAACPASRDVAAKIAPFAKGEVAALTVRSDPGPLPDLSFKAPDGAALTLANFKGKTVLLNLWATWCAPCRKEMPALDKLQADLGGADFEVVAINIDQRGGDKPEQFLEETGVKALTRYHDVSARVFSDLKGAGKAFGMPTTILIDKNGCELANLAGPAEWAGPDAFAVVKAALGR
jgi:thiol-disulfide isomerase/thioredoxin